MTTTFSDDALRLISKITDTIAFPAGNEDFDGVLDDCIDALDGKELPAYYSTCGFDFPETIPQDGYFPMMALHYLMESIDEFKIDLPDEIRAEVKAFFADNGIRFEWDKEKFIMDSFYPLDEDRVSDLRDYKEELKKDISEATGSKKKELETKLLHLETTISSVSGPKKEEKQSPMEKLKMLVVLNNGKDFTKAQLAAFDGIDPEDEPDGSDAEEEPVPEENGIRKLAGQDHWTDQYDENPDEYNA